MLVRQLLDPALAQYAYLVGCPRSGEAIVFDPERDIDRYLALAERHKLRIVAAADTHIHADYLTGLREFAERGVTVYASAEGGEAWQYEWLRGSAYPHRLLRDSDRFKVGNIEFAVLHTPGHTPEHVAYTVVDHGSGATEPIAVITGDFVFVGDLGRPDLLEQAAGVTGTQEPGARQLFQSLQRFRALAPHVQVWPGHGAGSACGKSLGDIPTSTVGYELRHNPAVRAADSEAGFVDYILSGQPEPPLYFARMKRENRAGPAVLGRLPTVPALEPAALGALAGRLDAAILDTRPRQAFLAAHVAGALLCEPDFQFVTIAGSYVPAGTPVYLVVEPSRLEEAVRNLVRIGLDDVRGYVPPAALEAWLATPAAAGAVARIESVSMAELEARRQAGGVAILDVRGGGEHALAHIPGAQHIAHTRLLPHVDEVPRDCPVLVHCGSGARSAHATALLQRHGATVVNVADTFARWQPAAPIEG
ncbi:MAG: MBL fold metallo-hydrolase [Gemmatimonadetes bacterium]|nr:MBL fold metallo-hydrolase [Gemmatimonadota bacterium]